MEKKVALITGASSGMGAASAVRLAQDGFNLAIAARREEALNEIADKCRKEGADVLVIKADMSNEDDVKNVFEKTVEKFGKIDFYFCNQGVLMSPKGFENQTLDDYYLVSENNFKSVFMGLVNCINVMKSQGGGKILVTGSSSGIRPEAGFGVYSASKHAVVGLTKDAAIECGGFNILINCLCPGGFDTPMVARVTDAFVSGDPTVEIRRSQPVLIPGRELGKVEEITGVVSFMASDESNYMQGSVISVDGGITL